MTKKLDPWALGLSAGVVWTIYTAFMGIAANFGWLTEWVDLLSKVYFGFEATPVGALIGCVWAFVDGVIGGALLATFYNILGRKITEPAE